MNRIVRHRQFTNQTQKKDRKIGTNHRHRRTDSLGRFFFFLSLWMDGISTHQKSQRNQTQDTQSIDYNFHHGMAHLLLLSTTKHRHIRFHDGFWLFIFMCAFFLIYSMLTLNGSSSLSVVAPISFCSVCRLCYLVSDLVVVADVVVVVLALFNCAS